MVNIKVNMEIEKVDFYRSLFSHSLKSCIDLEYDDVMEYINAIGEYNDFVPDKVKLLLEKLDLFIPKLEFANSGNPNNGHRLYYISIGRENSPVIYLKLFSLSGSSSNSEKAIENLLANMQFIEDMAKHTANVDEFSMTQEFNGNSHSLVIRLWWD